MAQAIPPNLTQSRAMQFIVSQGWDWKDAGGGQVQVQNCPFCKKTDYKFYMAVQDPKEGNRDGLFFCHHGSCQKTGNLSTLREHLGLKIAGVESRNDWADGKRPIDALPDIEECHATLLGDAEAMDYLTNVRGFSEEVISKFKLGIKEGVKFHKAGTSKALVIPYLVNGSIVYAKYRTLPYLTIKDFISPFMGAGFEVPLYNTEILQEGLSEIVLVEGEADALACLSKGITHVVGVPGAGVKKAMWIEALDRLDPKIYILFDNDRAGSKGAQELASRIGINRCYKIVLPAFSVPYTADDGTPKEREGKDVNEWFVHGGGTLEKFEELKKQAHLFNVTGVMGTGDAIGLLEEQLAGKVDLAPSYITQWPSFSRLVGFENGDVIDILGPEKQGKTTFALNLMDHMVKTYNEPGLFICLEMTHERLARKHVSLLTGFEDKVTEPGTPESKQKLEELIKACGVARDALKSRQADMYFAYPKGLKNLDDLTKFIVDCIRRYGVKWVAFDNLQLFCDNTLAQQNHRTVYLSQVSKGLTGIAKEWGIKMIRLLQPRQIGDNELIKSTHTDGSSQVRKDCDCLITIWRNSVGETKRSAWEKDQGLSAGDESFEPRMRVGLDLSRYSSGGHCTLFFDGARSLVREYTDEERSGFTRTQTNFNGVLQSEDEPASTTLTGVLIPTEPVAQEAITL